MTAPTRDRTRHGTRTCSICGFDYHFPTTGGYSRCSDCRKHPARRLGSWESRVCNTCLRDYLYPAYGGYKTCNTCKDPLP